VNEPVGHGPRPLTADGAAGLAAANLRAIVAMSLAMASFSVGDTLMKLSSASLPTSQLLFMRGGIVFAVSLSVAFLTGALRELRHVVERAMIGRVVGDVGGGWFFQSALARLPYADLTAITQLSPMALTAASAIFLAERVGWRRWTATAVGLLGVLIIVRPGGSTFSWWALAGIGSVLFTTLRDLSTRRINRRVPAILIMTLSAAGVTVAALLVAPFSNWQWPGQLLTLKLCGAAIFSLLGQLGVIIAMRTGEVSAVVPFRYMIILFSITSGVVVFGHFPDALTLLGIAIVTLAGLYTFYREQKLRRLAAPQS
jgi:drug/metabolite transporter (DMT)-like permease